MFQQYEHCQQGSRTIHEYTAEFMRLTEWNNLEYEGQQFARYLEGLRPALTDRIGVQVILDFVCGKEYGLKGRMNAENYKAASSNKKA